MDSTETPVPTTTVPVAPPTAQIPAQTAKPPVEPPTAPIRARQAEPPDEPAAPAVKDTPIYDQLMGEQLIDPVELSAEIAAGLAEYRNLLSKFATQPSET